MFPRVESSTFMVVGWVVGWVVAIGAASGCAVPCEADVTCADGQYCAGEGGERFCVSDCFSAGDCAFGETCSARGRCEAGGRALVEWLSPAEGAAVAESFDVVVEVRFVGREAILNLTIGETNGSPCGGFAPTTVRLPGVTTAESTHVVTLPGVRAAGIGFGLEVEVQVDGGEPRFARRSFRGPNLDEPFGLRIAHPVPGLVALPTTASTPLSTPIELTLDSSFSEVWARVIPEFGPPTPMRVIGLSSNTITGVRHAVALGRQTLELTFAQGGSPSVCRLALDAKPERIDPIEIALTFTGSEASDLDMWIYTETDAGDSRICTPQLASSPCLSGYARPGLHPFGEEHMGLSLVDGLYGVAVIPGAATAALSATLRISREGTHQTFVGPFTVQPAQGEVWLAARLYVVGGVLSIEPMYEIVSGAPATGPETW
jgi:hypothetical protein